MRILFLNPVGRMGGAETSLLNMLGGLREAEPLWDLHLLLGGEGPLTARARALGVTVTVLPFPEVVSRAGDAGIRDGRAYKRWLKVFRLLLAGLAALRYLHSLGRVTRRIRPDIIHSNGMKMHFLAAWTRSSVPLVWHMHDYLGQRPLMKRVLHFCSGRCAAVIANSYSVAADIAALKLQCSTVTIHNSVDFARFSPHGESYDLDAMTELPPAPAGTVRIGLLATFAHWKGHLVFIEAIGRLPKDVPVRAFIIGGGIYRTGGSQFERSQLEDAVRSVCPERIAFTGFLDDAAKAIRGLDIVVHASTRPEPFGMAILEGMACAKPVIAASAGGATEIFEDGVTALGHPMGDVEFLSRQILRLAQDAELRHALGSRARASACNRFGREKMALALCSLYRRLSPAATESRPQRDRVVETAHCHTSHD